MARTRTQIKTLIRSHTGLTKESLENSACDSALKLALMKHAFNDAISMPSDITLTEDEYKVDISSASVFGIVTARIVEAEGSRNTELIMKNRTWWDKNIINPEDNNKGWPTYGLLAGGYVYFNCPVQSGLELRLRITTEQTFASDSTACPIGVLDIFVEKYATYEVFMDTGNIARAATFKIQALGPDYDRGKIGGALRDAISFDEKADAEEFKMERGGAVLPNVGLAVENLNSDHERFGEVDTWY